MRQEANIRVCSGAFLFKDGSVLLGRRSDQADFYPGVWDAIGGHLKAGESPQEALLRELNEEIGVSPVEFALLASLPEPFPEIHGEAIYHIFLVTRWEGAGPVMQNAEHSQLRWFSLSDALRIDLAHPSYITLLRELLRQSD